MKDNEPEDEALQTHLLTLLSVSAAMVGVCLTAIGLVGILNTLNKMQVIVDELLAVGALLFMVVCMLSFLGVRTDLRRSWRGLSLSIDVLFCLGLVVLVAASILLAWVVS
jgi:cation transport ATPase